MNGLVVTVLVNGVERAQQATTTPRWIDGAAVRAQHGPRRRRLQQLARHLRQLRRCRCCRRRRRFDEHRRLRGRRRRPLHRRRAPVPGRSPPAGYSGTPSGTAAATSLMTLPARVAPATPRSRSRRWSRLTSGGRGGLVFDYYTDRDFKYVTLDLAAGAVVVGHLIRNQWVEDARFTDAARRRRRLPALALAERHRRHVTLNGTVARLVLVQRRGRRRRARHDQPDGHDVLRRRARRDRRPRLELARQRAAGRDPAGERARAPPTPARRRPSSATRRSARRARPTTSAWSRSSARGVPAGNLFPIGVTTITWTATDVFGNQTIRTQLRDRRRHARSRRSSCRRT